MKLGIIGTGRIAKRFVKEAAFVSDADISAVYNPHEGSAERFVNENRECFGNDRIPTAFTDFEGFVKAVDCVYIASVHETHYEYAKQCLLNSKHVLCEKPMTFKKAEAAKLFETADEKKAVLMEGLKSAYCPGYLKLLETVRSGIIGEIKSVDACFTKLEDPAFRELTDKKYGGSFTELGSYVLLPAFSLLGTEDAAMGFDSISDVRGNGLDIFTKVSISYAKNGSVSTALASGTVGLGVKSEGRLLISGTKGYITVSAPWWKTSHFEAHFEDPSKVISFDEPFEGDGLRYELKRFLDLASGVDTGSQDAEMRKISMAMAGAMESFMKPRSC